MTSHDVALQIMQEAVKILADWTEVNLPEFQSVEPKQQQVVDNAKKYLNWPKNQKEPQPLHLLFDLVDLSQNGKEKTEQKHYCPVGAIASTYPSIPYPKKEEPTNAELECLKLAIHKEITHLNQTKSNWLKNLPLVTVIIEKYGSCLSFGESDIALIDMARSTAAVAAALADNPEAKIALIAGDLSGIQNFIYTISSDGALKSLRARSFYLELFMEEVVQQLLTELKLPRTSIIYAGGGNLYILAANNEDNNKAIATIQERFNKRLRASFQGKLFLALDYLSLPTESVGNGEFAKHWNKVPKELAKQKLRKFESQLDVFLKPNPSYEPCRVCHRDDLPKLNPLNHNELDSSPACWMCRTVFDLGDKLFRKKVIVRSKLSNLKRRFKLGERLSFPGCYYYLFDTLEQALKVKGAETVFLINDWEVSNYGENTVPLLLGDYGKVIKTDGGEAESGSHYIRAGEMADAAQKVGCIPRVGYLRMDVDKLGQIFAKGLGEKQNLPRLAGLSRQMSYFFKVYLNSLAKDRCVNLPKGVKSLDEGDRQNLLFIYAGGDDLFVSGAWNEIVEFAFDVYQSFRAYTGYNPDITLSGGISIDDIKFPLYQSAESSGDAEELAKGNGKDSLGLFGTVFKWKQWLGATEFPTVQRLINELHDPNDKVKPPLDIKDKPDWLGVLPFVRSLYTELKGDYTRSFVRNLLITAELQEQAIKEKQKQIDKIKKKQGKPQDNPEIKKLEHEQEEIRYYLHLPKIAYTLARLPDRLRKEDSSFKPVRTSLKSPYNAPYFRAIATWIELLTRQK